MPPDRRVDNGEVNPAEASGQVPLTGLKLPTAHRGAWFGFRSASPICADGGYHAKVVASAARLDH
jgi:hypothetical protein